MAARLAHKQKTCRFRFLLEFLFLKVLLFLSWHFLGMLTAWKEALIEEQEKTEQLIQQDQSNFPDSLDRAAKEEEFMLELRKRERERKLIAKIDLSLKDLEDNLYGYCESCGVEIGIKRLEARPTATKCIDCKTVDEIKEKQQFG